MGPHRSSQPSSAYRGPLIRLAATIPPRGSRGQPVVALALTLALWIAVRVTLIAINAERPVGQPFPSQLGYIASAGQPGADPARKVDPPNKVDPAGRVDDARQGPPSRWPEDAFVADASRQTGAAMADQVWAATRARPAAPLRDQAPVAAPPLAAPLPAAPLQAADPAAGRAVQHGAKPAGQTERPRRARWSADGWALVRGGQSAPALAAGAAAYGGSQAGAVLRYNLAPASAVQPRVYLRAAGALAGPVRQAEGALGLMFRPVRRLPVSVLGEVRVQDNGGQVRVRPVITAVSELRPMRLPMGAEAEVYAQVGWAGGRGSTAFFDMAAVAQRCVAAPAPNMQLRLGGGLWSGGQRDAARLDLGPRLEMRGMLGSETRRIGVRLAVDWRFRVAGEAEPGSGPALTLAAGF